LKDVLYKNIVTDEFLAWCRYLERYIVTIREAAWLTDNTYKYEDVVRMMGEITAVLLGNFRVGYSYIVVVTVVMSQLHALSSAVAFCRSPSNIVNGHVSTM